MNEPVYLVTGATDGIGKRTAQSLLERGARVLIHGRTLDKAKATAKELSAAGKGEALPVAGDLSKMAEVRKLAESVLERQDRIDALVNNAGVFMGERLTTADGFEATFAVNHLAPFLLTHLLLPALLKSQQGRVVNVSSTVHGTGRIDLGDLQRTSGYDGYAAYAGSKLANLYFTHELARRLTGTKITVNALHPGVIDTKLLRGGFGMRGGGSVEHGARTSVFLATDPSVASVTGRYFVDEKQTAPASLANDPELERKLYEISAQLTGAVPVVVRR